MHGCQNIIVYSNELYQSVYFHIFSTLPEIFRAFRPLWMDAAR